MIRHYLKVAFRNLLKYRVQHFISILGIAIGFTAFVLGGYWYYWEHSFDTFHPDWKHTYALTTSGLFKTAEGEDAEIHQLHEQAEEAFRAFPEIMYYCKVSDVTWSSEGKEKQWMGLKTDSTFFDMFCCHLLDGTYKGNVYDDKSVILTRKTATQLFGNVQCTGEVFNVNQNVSFTVAGVMEDYPQNTEFKFDYILLGTSTPNNMKRSTIFVKVNPRADIKELHQKIEAYRLDLEDNMISTYSKWRSHLRSLPEVHLRCAMGLEARFRNINILAYAGILAFVSALMNLLVLFMGQQQHKIRNNITFSTLGASFRSLVGKNIIELGVFLIIAFLLSLAFIELIFPYYQHYTQLDGHSYYFNKVNTIVRKDVFYASVVLYLCAAVCFLLIALLPITAMLKRKKTNASVILKNSLITGQIFIGAIFLIASLGFYSQFQFISNTDKGIVLDNVWQIDLGFDAVHEKDCSPIEEALRNSPYIEDVTALSYPIISSIGEYYCSFVTALPIEGREGEPNYEDNCLAVAPNFLSFFGLHMKEGEWITNEGAYDYVINETGARMLGIEDISGREIIAEGNDLGIPLRVSGIMADYHFCPLRYPIDKTFFVVLRKTEEGDFYIRNQYYYIKVQPQHKEKALAYTQQLYKEYEKGAVESDKQIMYLPDVLEEFNRPEKSMCYIFSVLSLICILISSFGIYALVSFSTEQRRKEIAIRKVNGAGYPHILSLFLKEYFVLVVLANAIALPLGYVFITRWLETYAYHTTLSWGFYASIFLITCGVVVAAVAHQVTYAIKINPSEMVKSE